MRYRCKTFGNTDKVWSKLDISAPRYTAPRNPIPLPARGTIKSHNRVRWMGVWSKKHPQTGLSLGSERTVDHSFYAHRPRGPGQGAPGPWCCSSKLLLDNQPRPGSPLAEIRTAKTLLRHAKYRSRTIAQFSVCCNRLACSPVHRVHRVHRVHPATLLVHASVSGFRQNLRFDTSKFHP